MARLALAVAGAVVGNIIAPGIGGSIGFALGSLAGSLLFPEKLPTIFGPRLEDRGVQSGAYGTAISRTMGTDRVAGLLVWVLGNRIIELVNEEEQGGKGGPTQTTVTYSYFATCAVAVGVGPILGIRRIWADTKLIFDIGGARLQAEIAAGGAVNAVAAMPGGSIRFYLGTETQEPDGAIAAEKGANATPAMRGIAYIVFDMLPLANFGNRIPNFTFEVVRTGATSFPIKDLTTTVAASTADVAHLIDRFGPYIWNISGVDTITRWDLASLQAGLARDLSTVAAPLGGLMTTGGVGATDETGNLYVLGATLGLEAPNRAHLFKLDADTLTPLAQLGSPIMTGGRNLAYRYWPGNPKRWLVKGAFNGWVHLIDPVTMILLADPDVPGHGTGGVAIGMIEIDPNNVIWVAYSTGTTSRLLRYEVLPAVFGPYPYLIHFTNNFDLTSTFGSTLRVCRWYADEGVLLLGSHAGGSTIAKFDPVSLTVTVSKSGLGHGSVVGWERGPVDGRIWNRRVVPGVQFLEIDLATLTVLRSFDASNWDAGFSQPTNVGYVPLVDAILGTRTFVGRSLYFLPRLDPLDITLASVITEVCGQAGIGAGKIDVALVTDSLRGYTLNRPMSARAALDSVLGPHRVDAVEVDGKIRFVPRGTGSSIQTLLADDLGAGEDAAAPDRLAETRVQEFELPERLSLRSISWQASYDPAVQQAKRAAEAVSTREDIIIDLPAVVSYDQAKRLAARLLTAAWAERTRLKFALNRKHLKLIPTDLVTVQRGGASYLARIEKIALGVVLDCEAVAVETSTDISAALGAATTIPTAILQLLAGTRLFLIDSTIARDEDDNVGFYLGGAPDVVNALWSGFAVWKSADNIAFDPFDAFTAAVDHGVAQTKLAAGDGTFVFDRVNTIDVKMVKGQPVSATELEVLNGANAALLQTGADWEVIQWQVATDQGGDVWRLSLLLRGRRGTEALTGGHAAGDRLIMLNAAKLFRPVIAAERGLLRYWKGMTIGAVVNTAGALPFTNFARGLKPYSPVVPAGSRDGSQNLTITWIRRTRVGGHNNWADAVTVVPIGEASELYDLEVMNGAVVVRTFTGLTAPTVTYTAAQQTTDFGSPQASVTVRIYQTSAVFGRGAVLQAVV